jgi:hypothetical protein
LKLTIAGGRLSAIKYSRLRFGVAVYGSSVDEIDEIMSMAFMLCRSPVTDYAKQNGGKFEFIVESEASLPVEEAFWDFLLSSSKETWNLLVYEQDWLDVAVTRLQALRVGSPPPTV